MYNFHSDVINIVSDAVKANPIRRKDIPVMALAGLPPETTLTPEDRNRNPLPVVIAICNKFRKHMEDNALCRLLYHKGKLQHERVAQDLFFMIADMYCELQNFALSREPNAGAGAVDFKISKGYSDVVTVEIKYSSNPNLISGYTKQLTAYNKAERTSRSVYLVLRTDDSISKLNKLGKVCEDYLATIPKIFPPRIFVIDARIKPSASKR